MNEISKRLLALVQVVLLVISFPCVAHGQSAKEAIKALNKIKARVTAGISYRDYPPALGDARFEVDQYLKSNKGNQDSLIGINIAMAMLLYEDAARWWELKFSSPSRYLRDFHIAGFLKINEEPDKSTWSGFVKLYPEANKDVKSGGALVSDDTASISMMLQFVWSDAAKKLAEAESLLSGSGSKPKSKK